jgi:hypothetical protein
MHGDAHCQHATDSDATQLTTSTPCTLSCCRCAAYAAHNHSGPQPVGSCDVAGCGDAVSTAKVLIPHCVEPALLVGALVGVGPEEIALRLWGVCVCVCV